MRISVVLGMLSFAAVAVGGAAVVRSWPQPTEAIERAAGTPIAVDGALRWEARLSPPEDRSRVRARLDGEHVQPVTLVGDDGISIDLSELSPGPHVLDLTVERRGGRITRYTDEVLAGPWQADHERGCDLGLALGPEGIRDLLLPVVEEKILAGARANEYFGPTSYLARRELDIVDGGLRFDVMLDTDEEGKGDLVVAGVIDVRGQGDAGITASLRYLDNAAPGPKLEEMARKEGGRKVGAIGVTVGGGLVAATGGGALLGLAVAAGGGWIGSKFGEKIGAKTAKKEVRREAQLQIERALQVATDALRLPEGVAVLPTEPALLADLRWCEPPSLTAAEGLRATLRLRLHDDELGARAAAQAVYLGTALPELRSPTSSTANVHVDVSGDLVNRLLAEWVVRGGLQAELDRSGLAQEVQAALGDRTRWQVQALGAELPPVVWLRGEAGIDTALAGVRLELLDPERGVLRTVVLGGAGALRLVPQEQPGLVRLNAALERMHLGCREREGDRERRLPCFSSAVDPEVLRELIDEQLRVHADRLPVLDLAAPLRLQIFGDATPRALRVAALDVVAGDGVLRIDARVE